MSTATVPASTSPFPFTINQCVHWLRNAQERCDEATRSLIDDVIEDLQRLGSVTSDTAELILGALGSVASAIEVRQLALLSN